VGQPHQPDRKLLERYYPGRPIESKVGFFLEELLAASNPRAS
jgi:hypothetical protein